ncbi:hypothetical protein Aperf_G00000019994 [Anoplocephala perfoliata]
MIVFTLAALIPALLQIADFRRSSQNQALRVPSRKETDVIVPDDTTDRLFWFMQLSDLHLSRFGDNGRTTDFSKMCGSYIRTISPDIVIISGDITDAKYPAFKGSQQFKKEWLAYATIIKESGISNDTIWLDLRGNHDNFNVPSAQHFDNLFREYSVIGRNFTQSYMVTHRKSFGTYSFIAMDACPSPGLKRPFNFFGLVTPDLSKSLQSFSPKAQGSNQTFWFGHYPTSTIVSPNFDLRKFISETAYCYLCGHLHSLMTIAPSMYTVQPQGFLELELADWRDGRFFRIVAVDNDLVSFVDSQMHRDESQDWPIVLITNPKNAGFLLPNKEPTDRILGSTHIRILAWSSSPITQVSVTVDNEFLGYAKPTFNTDSTLKPSPLFVLPWKPAELMKQGPTHVISVVCEDAKGYSRKVEHIFTLDGTTRWNFGGLQSFILLSDQEFILMLVFYSVWCVPFIALLIARIFGRNHVYDRICADFCQLEGLRELASSNVLFTCLMCYLIYLLCGPIFMGYLLEHSFGFVFTFGVFTNNTYLPEGTTYLTEIFQQFIFTYPLLFLLVCRIRGRRSCQGCCLCCHFCSWPCCELLAMLLLTLLQLAFSIFGVLLPYGWLAFILSPGRLWLVALGWGLFIYSGRAFEVQRIK